MIHGPTVASIWVMFAQASISAGPDVTPKDAATKADTLMKEFKKRFKDVGGSDAYTWERQRDDSDD